MSNNVYSYHTFFYPFLLTKSTDADGFCKKIADSSQWIPDNIVSKRDDHISSIEANSLDEAMLDYQTYQYFNPAARDALFNQTANIVHCYQYRTAKGGRYFIATDVDEKGEKTGYSLNIDAIRLKVFNTNVAVIVFELEYPIPSEGLEQARKDIFQINEYGRRVYPEFLTKAPDGFLLCANSLEITTNDGQVFSDDFRGMAVLEGEADTAKKWKKNQYLKNPAQLPNIITGLLGTTEKLRPAIDSRMFVCCCVADEEYAKSFIVSSADETACFETLRKQTHRWRFMEDWDVGCELYALLNIDAGGSTCQNRVMLDRYLEEQLYPRWLEYGTIHAVTNHSMFCLTSPWVTAQVINPFLIQYVQMAILVQVQRASLLAFDERITQAVSQIQNNERDIDTLKSITKLQADFAVFQGQLYLEEVTPQIQGIEIYEKLQKLLFVDKLYQGASQRLHTLYEITQAKIAEQEAEDEAREEKRTKHIEFVLSALAVLSVISTIVDVYGFSRDVFSLDDSLGLALKCVAGILGITLILVFMIYQFAFRKEKEDEK